MRLKIWGKFIIPTLVLIVLCMGVLSLTLYLVSAHVFESSAIEEMDRLAKVVSDRGSEWFDERRRELKTWSLENALIQCLRTHLDGYDINHTANQFLVYVKEEYGFYESVRLLDPEGLVIASSEEEGIGLKFGGKDYFQAAIAGEPFVSKAFDEDTKGHPYILFTYPIIIDEKPQGVLYATVDLSYFGTKYIDPVKVGESGYAYLYQNDGLVLTHPDKENVMTLNLSEYEFGREMLGKEEGTLDYNFNGINKLVIFKKLKGVDLSVAIGVPTGEIFAVAHRIGYISLGATLVLAAILAMAMSLIVRGLVTRPLSRAVALTHSISLGDLDNHLTSTTRDEMGELADSLNNMTDSLKAKASLASSIAQGDLTRQVNLASEQDDLGRALVQMTGNLNTIVNDIKTAVNQISAGSDQITSASGTLSEGANEQAASLEEITASLNDLTSQTATNADHATRLHQLAMVNRTSAEHGKEQMNDMIAAMSDINLKSEQIARIVSSIDNIAFQTNILSLNAAVEAARAGVHGKGFAVVAREVKALATRSAEAARETSELIESSMAAVQKGTEIVQAASQSFEEINGRVIEVAQLVGDISQAGQEQAVRLEQINQSLGIIEQVTLQNTAQANQTASAAVELTEQVGCLSRVLHQFKLNGHGNQNVCLEPRLLENLEAVPSCNGGEGVNEGGSRPLSEFNRNIL